MNIDQIMRVNLITLSPSAPLETALKLHGEHHYESRLTYVIHYDTTLLGVITFHDLLKKLIPEELVTQFEGLDQPFEAQRHLLLHYQNIRRTPVEHLMAREFPTLAPTDSILHACALFQAREVTAIPVVDKNGLLVGEVTRRLLVRALAGRLLD